MYLDSISALEELLKTPADAAIVIHRNPDGDALGSGLAWTRFLKNLGHSPVLISPSEYPDNFEWMPGISDMLIYDLEQDKVKEVIDKAGVIFCLDFNALDRIDHVGKMIHETDCKKVLVDHHVEPEPFADLLYSDPTASSTSELLYRLISELGMKNKMDDLIAEALFTGILTDTGSFRHSTSARLFRVAADLKEMGVDDYKIQDKVFNSYKEKQLRLLGHCLLNRMEVLEEDQTAMVVLTKEDYKEFDIQRGDTEGIVNYLLMMPHIKVAALISEQPKLVKISLRSKGTISVQALARNHFNGGGHVNASGGYSFKPIEVITRRFKSVVGQYVHQKKSVTNEN